MVFGDVGSLRPVPGQQFVDAADLVIGDPCDHVPQLRLGIEPAELGGSEQAIHYRRPLPAAIGAAEQPRFPTEGHRPSIVPMPGRMLTSITAGIRCMAVAFG